MTADLVVRPYEDADQAAVLDLLTASLGDGPTGDRSAEYFAWKHHRNPFGRSYGLVAESDGVIVGFRAFMRWAFTDGTQTLPAVRAVDTATHPDHQGRGIFTRLTLGALDDLKGSTALVFNTPNEKSLPGYLKMGWETVGTVPLHIRVRRPLRFAGNVRAITRGVAAGTPDSPLPTVREFMDGEEAAIGALLAEPRPAGRLQTVRTLDYLRWRYADAPGLDYRVVEVRAGTRLTAMAVVRPRFRGVLSELTVCDALMPHGNGRGAASLLRAVARAAEDHATLHAARGGPITPGLATRMGFVPAPLQGVTLVARALQPVHPDPARLHSWSLSIGDLELF